MSETTFQLGVCDICGAPATTGWQLIEIAPPGKYILIAWHGQDVGPVIGALNDDGEWEDKDGIVYFQPTHWMYVPSPPGLSSSQGASQTPWEHNCPKCQYSWRTESPSPPACPQCGNEWPKFSTRLSKIQKP